MEDIFQVCGGSWQQFYTKHIFLETSCKVQWRWLKTSWSPSAKKAKVANVSNVTKVAKLGNLAKLVKVAANAKSATVESVASSVSTSASVSITAAATTLTLSWAPMDFALFIFIFISYGTGYNIRNFWVFKMWNLQLKWTCTLRNPIMSAGGTGRNSTASKLRPSPECWTQLGSSLYTHIHTKTEKYNLNVHASVCLYWFEF